MKSETVINKINFFLYLVKIYNRVLCNYFKFINNKEILKYFSLYNTMY